MVADTRAYIIHNWRFLLSVTVYYSKRLPHNSSPYNSYFCSKYDMKSAIVIKFQIKVDVPAVFEFIV